MLVDGRVVVVIMVIVDIIDGQRKRNSIRNVVGCY